MTTRPALSSLPFALGWERPPVASGDDGESALWVEAGPITDLFVNPADNAETVNAPRLLGVPPDGDFQLRAHVDVPFGAAFDAGAILLWADARHWAKLCLEYSPAGEPMIVSVVTRGVSDDANGFPLTTGDAWLRASRSGRALAFHASTDGRRWSFVRHFDVGAELTLVGFAAQSPTGQGCRVSFDRIEFRPEGLADLRDGT